MSSFEVRARRCAAVSAWILVVAFSSSASAAALYVAGNGTDSGTCGGKETPCRSITQTIANSVDGDDIVVGPGRYGDLDRDGILGETGEEPSATCSAGNCLIVVDKSLSVVSSSGAFSTVIDPGPENTIEATIELQAPESALGAPNKGFTLYAPAEVLTATVNVVYQATDSTVTACITHAPDGDHVGYSVDTPGAVLTGNHALGGSAGFVIGASSINVLLTGNSATGGNGDGFILDGIGTIAVGAVANANRYGMIILGTDVAVRDSSVLANAREGVRIQAPATATIVDSNIYGNGTDGGFINCGINVSGGTLTATDVWWGAATGPGPDPADAACNMLPAATTPFATMPVKVKVKPLR